MSPTSARAAVPSRRPAVVLLALWAALTMLVAGLTAAAPARAADACAPGATRCAAESTPVPTLTSTPVPTPTSTPVPTWAPLPPTSLSVTGTTSSSVSLTWGESLHATSYEVERATGPSGAFERITETFGRSHTDTGLTAGLQYRYRVRGVNLTGPGPYSAEVTAVVRPSICTTKVTATSTWDGGYVLDVTITNTSTFAFYLWQSTVTLPAGHAHVSSWPGQTRVSGQTITAWSQSWNGNLAPGQTARWGVQATRPSGDATVPVSATCVVAVPAAPA
ncbi:cellulose binding domain-containing protein [Myceligenerans crystallogenes]|uniref:Fibronectin type III domain-containing protein n=1 Tax=Myceligenerans crystallogenes TaxID=316335 RepID=A0ABN2NHM7_9MICO